MSEARIKSADELIFQDESRKLGKIPSELAATSVPETPPADTAEHESPEDASPETAPEQKTEAKTESQTESQPEQSSTSESAPADENVDDYGNPIAKPKTYTEDEVQAMIRKRLREKHSEQPAAVQQAAQDFKADPESEESWEAQLGNFVEKKITELAEKKQQQAWQESERQSQVEFETKFTTGMQKYSDFESTVSGKPISTAMMMATRSMQDPAAFLYAACKQNPGEIERIAKISDPYAQVAEMGRLEERMKKARILTNAPAPARRISGDITADAPKQSIDDKIIAHGKSKVVHHRK